MKNEDEALATAEQAREILEHAGGKYFLELYSTYELIGMIQIRKGNRPAAIEALKRALRAAERLDTRRIGKICDKRFVENSYSSDCVVNILITLGELSLREERFDNAMGYSKRAINVAKGTT